MVNVAGIHTKREDQLLLSRAAVECNHGVQKQRARSKIDNRRAGDAHGIKLRADEIVSRHCRTNVSLPDNAAVNRVERVDVVRFSRDNDYRPAARTVLDIKRLRIHVADDRAVKVQVPRQIGRSALCESRVNIKTVARRVIVKLGHVHLRVCGNNCSPETHKEN